MKGAIHLPEDFELFDARGIFLWDENGELIAAVRDAIYLQPLFSHLFIDENLFGMVWWNDELGYWCAELYVDGDYINTYICETPEDLKAEIEEDYAERFG